MSTTTLNSLLEYLYGTLTPSNMRWVGEQLIAHAEQTDDFPLPRYTMDDINAMLDEAEREAAAGLGIPDEEMWKKWEKILKGKSYQEAV